MSATRTQVYLTEEQRARIDRAAEAEGVTMAEVIRRAIDQYVKDETDPATALAATLGAAPNADTPGRDSWQRG
jgi:predicted DNA-binding protein